MGDVSTRLLDALPYLDGSGRRRLVTGVLFLTGLVAGNLDTVDQWARRLFGGVELQDVLKSPILIGVAVVLAYAVGNFIELLGDMVIAPIACGVIGEAELACRTRRWLRLPSTPFLGALNGLLGHGRLEFDFCKCLSAKTQQRFADDPLPASVVDGLRYPLGTHAELSVKYIADSFRVERSQRWAHQMITRVKDVSALITVAVILLAIFGIPRVVAIVTAEPPPHEFLEAARVYQDVVREAMQIVDQQIYERDVKSCDSVCGSVKHIQDIVRSFVLDRTDVNAFAGNVRGGLVELKALNQRSRDLHDTVLDMNARVYDFSKLGSESMQHDERLCREIAGIGRDLYTALVAVPSGPTQRSLAPMADLSSEALRKVRGQLDEIEGKTICPANWWEIIDTINHLARFLDPVDPAVIDPLIRQGEKLVQSVSVAEHEFSIGWLLAIYVAFAGVAVLPFYLVLVRSLRAGLANILEALAIERDESVGRPCEGGAASEEHSA